MSFTNPSSKIFVAGKRRQYDDDGLINDNDSDAEAGSAIRKKKKKQGMKRKQKSGTLRQIGFCDLKGIISFG